MPPELKPLDEMTDEERRAEHEKYRSEAEARAKKDEADAVAAAKAEEEAEAEAERKKATAVQTGPSDAEWAKMEEHYGMSREELEKQHKFTSALMKPLQEENAKLKRERSAETAVSLAMKEEAKKDRQFAKLKPFVEEYLEKVPMEFKSDPKLLAKEMKFALGYAKGSVPRSRTPEPAAEGDPTPDNRQFSGAPNRHLEDDPNDGGGDDQDEVGVYDQTHRGNEAMPYAKVRIDDRVGKDYRKKNLISVGDSKEVRIKDRSDWKATEKAWKANR